MSRYFYDCEFLENGQTIELISIGIVSDQGDEYYAVNKEVTRGALERRIRQEPWLMANVVPALPQPSGDWNNHMPKKWLFDYNSPLVHDFDHIADEVRDFLLSGDGKPELWAYYGAYDHVALCQLWGRMIDLPDGVPMFTRDIKQEAERLGNPALPEQAEGEHNALADARHNKVMFDFLTEHERAGIAALRRVR